MTFRCLPTSNIKLIQRDQKLKNKKCKCHHHKQQICPKKLNKSLDQIDELSQRLHNQAQRFKNRKLKEHDRIKAIRDEKQMQGCTFSPALYASDIFVSKSSFLQRQLTWSQSKARKIKLQKQRKDSLETVGCEFTPKIIKNSEKIISRMKAPKKTIQAKKNPEEVVQNSYMSLYYKNKNSKKSSLVNSCVKKVEPTPVIKGYEQTNESLNEIDIIESQVDQSINKEEKQSINIDKQAQN